MDNYKYIKKLELQLDTAKRAMSSAKMELLTEGQLVDINIKNAVEILSEELNFLIDEDNNKELWFIAT
jgi:hypothetical protein